MESRVFILENSFGYMKARLANVVIWFALDRVTVCQSDYCGTNSAPPRIVQLEVPITFQSMLPQEQQPLFKAATPSKC